MPFLERRPEILRFTRAHALDEVFEVRLSAIALLIGG